MVGYRVYLGADRIVGGEEGGVMAQVSSLGLIANSPALIYSIARCEREKGLKVFWGWGPQEDLEARKSLVA